MLAFHLGADPLFLRPKLGRELLPEIVGVEDGTDLELGLVVEGRALEPLDGLVNAAFLVESMPAMARRQDGLRRGVTEVRKRTFMEQ
jgi:hypothetical protein